MTAELRVIHDAPALVDPYVDHYRRIESLTHGLLGLWRITDDVTCDSFDVDAVLGVFLPGFRDPRQVWDDLADPLDRLNRLDAAVAVDIEQESGQRHPNAVDSYARIADEIRNEIAMAIRHHRRTNSLEMTR